MYSNTALSLPIDTGSALSQVHPSPSLCHGTSEPVPSSAEAGEQDSPGQWWPSPQRGQGLAGVPKGWAGGAELCTACLALRSVCLWPGPARTSSEPTQLGPSPSKPQAQTTSPTSLAPISQPCLGPATGYLPSRVTHWHEQPIGCWQSAAQDPPRCPAHLWDAKGKSKSPPTFDEISLSYALLAFDSSASHMHPDGLALTYYERSSLRDL